MATDVMISAQSLTKRFGTKRALDNISFEVTRGEVVGFLGPNGAGKSTTMRILTCFLAPTSGTATVHGRDVFDDPLGVRQALGYLPQRAPLYTDMTVWDYLHFTAKLRGLEFGVFKKRLGSVVEICGLARVLGQDIGTLSHGYRQRVGLAQALIHNPPILILDEPTSDLDPNEKAELISYIKEIGRDRTVLLSTHNLAEVEEACARAIIVSKGRVVADGAIEDIRARSGAVRYVVSIDETQGRDGAPKAEQVAAALAAMAGGEDAIRELPTDERAHRFELRGPSDTDLRAALFRLMVDQGWTLLELRRDAQTLDAVFRDLTVRDEALDRGRKVADEEDEDEDDDLEDEDDDEEDEERDEDEGDDAADDEPAKKPAAKASDAPASKKPTEKEN